MAQDYSYLDLLDRKLDDLQKNACCRLDNTIVAAGAGSGKTQVLATRFAWLVMSCGISAGKILTLTFTKKAAAEMYERIYHTLNFFASREDVPKKERENAQRALDEFSETHIQTLDSYCHSLVRQCANRYGISPDFGEGDKLDVNQLALSFVFNHKEEEEIKEFAEIGGFQDLAKNYFAFPVTKYTTIANYKGFFIDKLDVQKQILTEEWNKKVSLIDTFAEEIRNHLEKIDKENHDIDFLRNHTAVKNVPKLALIKDSELIETQQFDEQKMLENITWLEAFFNSGCKYRRNQKEELESDLYTYVKESSGMQETIEILYDILQQIKKWPVTKKLLYRIEEFSNIVNTKKRESGSLSFDDITQIALKILMEQKDIRTQEKNAYSKIMIDEFQDNNSKNRDLLFLLSERNDIYTEFPKNTAAVKINEVLKDKLEAEKLYFVGDEKQSIYKFRGADVSVFNELSKDLNTEPIHMSNNYRSTNQLLASINQIFGGFTAGKDDDEENPYSVFDKASSHSYEATFPKAAKAQQVDRNNHSKIELEPLTEDNVSVHVCMYNPKINVLDEDGNEVTEKFLNKDAQQGYFIAKSIRQKYDEAQGNLNYSSFAIIDHSRNPRHNITAWLNKFGVPYTVDSQTRIFEEAPINDIYNYVRVCVYPSDINAFAALLTSPFVNLSQNAVEIVLACLKPTDLDGNYEAFEMNEKLELALGKYKEDFDKYKKAAEDFIQNRKKFLGQRITASVTQLWQEQSYYFETLTDPKVNLLAEQYDLLFEIARDCDENSKSLAWFVDELDRIRENEKSFQSEDKEETEIDLRNIEYPVEQSDAVRILTIHKSKGLEFPIVYLTGVTDSCREASCSGSYFNEEINFSIQAMDTLKNHIFSHFSEDENARELAEFKRLIYVGVTRAKNECFIVGSWPSKNTSKVIIMKDIITHYYPDINPDDTTIPAPECGYNVFVYNEASPFDYLYIEPQTEQVNLTTNYKTGLGKSKKELISFAKKYYEDSKVIQTPVLESNRKAPHDLETDGNEIIVKEPMLDCMTGIEEVIYNYLTEAEKQYLKKGKEQNDDEKPESTEELENANFNYAAFGTLAHAFLCDFIKSGMKDDFSTEDYTGGIKLYKDLNIEDSKKITECCIGFCKSFAKSTLGGQVKAAIESRRFVRAEWGFKMFDENLLYTGSIDLIFKNEDGSYTIVDYKTDRKYNNEKYLPQQLCYRKAAAKLLDVEEEKIDCKLFYLRYGKEESLT